MDSRESSGGLVDDEGNLLGVVNVVDALVVLLVLAVGLAGTAALLGWGQPTSERVTADVTVDLGPQPTYLAAAIQAGDSYSPGPNANLTVTDVHLAPAGNGTHVVVGARVTSSQRRGPVRFANGPLRLGRRLDVNTSTYNVTGRVTDVGDGAATVSDNTTVVVRDRLAPSDAAEVRPGDRVTVGGRRVATVTDVVVRPSADADNSTVLVEAALATYGSGDDPMFGGTALRPGRSLRLSTSAYSIDGRVDSVGTGLERDGLTNRTVTLALRGVRPEVATAVRPGQTDRDAGRPTATVTDVTTTPTPVVATAPNGSVVAGDHPTLRDVTLTTELRVRETSDGPAFRGDRLQYGSTVVLDLGPVTVETTVVDIGQ